MGSHHNLYLVVSCQLVLLVSRPHTVDKAEVVDKSAQAATNLTAITTIELCLWLVQLI